MKYSWKGRKTQIKKEKKKKRQTMQDLDKMPLV